MGDRLLLRSLGQSLHVRLDGLGRAEDPMDDAVNEARGGGNVMRLEGADSRHDDGAGRRRRAGRATASARLGREGQRARSRRGGARRMLPRAGHHARRARSRALPRRHARRTRPRRGARRSTASRGGLRSRASGRNEGERPVRVGRGRPHRSRSLGRCRGGSRVPIIETQRTIGVRPLVRIHEECWHLSPHAQSLRGRRHGPQGTTAQSDSKGILTLG